MVINTKKCVLMPKKCWINTLYYHVFAGKFACNSLKKCDLDEKLFGKCVCAAYLCSGFLFQSILYILPPGVSTVMPWAELHYAIVWNVMLAFTRAIAVTQDAGISCGSYLVLKLSSRM